MNAVLVPFPYAGDGFTVEWLNVGDARDFGSATDGLVLAGLVAAGAAATDTTSAADTQSTPEGEGAPPTDAVDEPTSAPPKKRDRQGRV